MVYIIILFSFKVMEQSILSVHTVGKGTSAVDAFINKVGKLTSVTFTHSYLHLLE